MDDLDSVARRLRGQLISLSHHSKTPHLGSGLSCLDIILTLYSKVLQISPDTANDPSRDRFILSKGHAAAALYVVLAEKGFFPKELLDHYGKTGCRLTEHPSPNSVRGVEVATGSLGHGLSMGLGMAMAGRLKGLDYRVDVLLSDGECNEGSVWEAAQFAAAQKLSNVTVIIDYNKWQATGRSEEVMAIKPLADKWRACGWQAVEVDGHNHQEINNALSHGLKGPLAVVAHTVKGKGVSWMEDDNNWHYRIPTGEEVVAAKKELELVTV